MARAQAGSSEGAEAPPAKEEGEGEEEDNSLGGHLVEAAKVTHESDEVSLLSHSVCS